MRIEYDFLSTMAEVYILDKVNAILGIGTELRRPVVYYVIDDSLPKVEWTIQPVYNNIESAVSPNACYLGTWKDETSASTVHFVAYKEFCPWANPIHGGNE